MKLAINKLKNPTNKSNKLTNKPITPAEYIKAIPLSCRAGFKELHQIIIAAAPEAIQGMTYGMLSLKLNGLLLCYASHKGHYGLYPMPATIITFKDKLVKYETSKGAIKFNHGESLPKKIIADIVKYRVNQKLGKSAKLAKSQ